MQALQLATPEQLKVLEENYARKDDECEARVKALYVEMGLEAVSATLQGRVFGVGLLRTARGFFEGVAYASNTPLLPTPHAAVQKVRARVTCLVDEDDRVHPRLAPVRDLHRFC